MAGIPVSAAAFTRISSGMSAQSINSPLASAAVRPASGWFMPPELTPLYHTSLYSELSEADRVAYNQLHALYFHEQIIFFEQSIICPVLKAIRPRRSASSLRSSIDDFIAEENRHSALFHALLEETAPALYSISPRCFIQSSPIQTAALNWGVGHPGLFPMYLWLILLLEERAMFCSRKFLEQENVICASFFQVQRQHLADEVDHLKWDEAIIERLWPRAPLQLRRLNVGLLGWMLREFIVAPKRAALRVIDALVEQRPALHKLASSLKKALRELGQAPDYQRSIFGGSVAVRAQRLMRQYPEFDGFRSYWFHHED